MRSVIILCATLLASSTFASAYDSAVLRDRPALYLTLASPKAGGVERDLAHGRYPGTYWPLTSAPKRTRLPNGDTAAVFDGRTQYGEIATALSLSARPGHAITIEAWMRPDTLQFPNQEGAGYVHFAGKGESGEHEWVCRMYSLSNLAARPNRISGYVYNPQGAEGSGSYFQDVVRAGEWIHYALVIDGRAKVVRIFKNGVLRDTTPFSQFNVTPVPGNAPVRIATRDFRSFFQGALGKFAIYSRALDEATLKAHFQKMR